MLLSDRHAWEYALLTGSLWMGLGMGVGRLIGSARGWKGFNLGMAVLMVGCVVMIWR